MEQEQKSLLESKTFWGAVLMLAAAGAQLLGYDLGDTGPFAEAIVGAIGAVLALYGRIKAVKKIR